MSGNPMGLSEISHFGSFQRVGGKAGGFINKKWFHPSSLRNQEKLWQAQTKDERETRVQSDMQKRRDEEMQVEDLRKQMYLSGQGKATDFLSSSVSQSEAAAAPSQKMDQRTALDEEKKRKAMLKQQQRGSADEVRESEESGLAKSRYPEDEYVLGHHSVWGSWYSVKEERWGFDCCRQLIRDAECTADPEEVAAAAAQSSSSSRKAQKTDKAEEERGGLAHSEAPAEPKRPLIDAKLIEAGEQRIAKKKREEAKKEEAKSGKASGYLADLLADPSGT